MEIMRNSYTLFLEIAQGRRLIENAVLDGRIRREQILRKKCGEV
jgi:hypothetical protein